MAWIARVAARPGVIGVSSRLVVTVVASLLAVTVALSAAASTPAAEEAEEAELGRGELLLLEEIARYFGVDAEVLQALRAQGYGMGEIVLLYALAASAPGDTLEQRVASVLSYREEGLGWGEIARELGIHPSALGQAVASVLRGPRAEGREATPSAGAESEEQMRLREQVRLRQEERLQLALSVQKLLPEQARAEVAPVIEELRVQLARSTAAGGPSGDGQAKGPKAPSQGAAPSGSAGGGKGSTPKGPGDQPPAGGPKDGGAKSGGSPKGGGSNG